VELILQYLYLSFEESWTTYEKRVIRISLAILALVFLEYYEFYGPNQAHYFQEIEELNQELQRTHILYPKDPFCNHNIHQSVNTQELCTIWLKCIPDLLDFLTVKGCLEYRPLQDPKSAILMTVSSEINMFSLKLNETYGLMSQWKIPFRCICSIPLSI